MVNSKEFTKRLEKILEFYGLTASAFAEEIDFNRSTISHLISGRNKPSLDFVMKILQKFPEVEMDWLVLGKGNFPSDGSLKKGENKPGSKSVGNLKQIPDLFSVTQNSEKRDSTTNSNLKNIERIVIFFEDGSFKVYQN
ncbi:XRE family transcriptional regulator [Aequorivita sp. H23M31]|uniref:XRE family transcriptional regulator n=1 Tax=Aequorivita ciconiae TaxID=2494375 RepID=A0A410G7H8_9FLAO|nr:helix-turn-helix transcriptional regulator [Aequorivita sp. H23M31]QAA83145.1 XRE family transcriptional regulator [Aequorivita sp. H23M31]